MSWLQPAKSTSSSWEDVASLAPVPLASICELQASLWDVVDPVLLDLCRLRIASLVGAPAQHELRGTAALAAGLRDEKVVALPAWPTSPLFSAREKACLALAEQFVIDLNGIDQHLIDDVLEHLTPAECDALVTALWALESFQRACLILDAMPPPEAVRLTSVRAD